MHHFLIIFTHQHTDNDRYTNLLALSIKIGKLIVQKYLVELNGDKSDVKVSYSTFLATWKKDNEIYADLLDSNDTFNSSLGCKLIEVLEFSDMVKKHLVTTAYAKRHQELVVSDQALMSKLGNHSLLAVPTKLPMIVKPRPYGIESEGNVVGGYLLNDVYYHEGLIINNNKFKTISIYTEEICDMVNKISWTALKINTTLLDFLFDPINDKYDLLIDSTIKHKYADIVRTRSQERIYRSDNSKVTLQESILEIANFYRNFNEIYFPVRIDQRGRLYCIPGFFNYQSNELSKALLLFSKPGVIKKDNLEAILYL